MFVRLVDNGHISDISRKLGAVNTTIQSKRNASSVPFHWATARDIDRSPEIAWKELKPSRAHAS